MQKRIFKRRNFTLVEIFIAMAEYFCMMAELDAGMDREAVESRP